LGEKLNESLLKYFFVLSWWLPLPLFSKKSGGKEKTKSHTSTFSYRVSARRYGLWETEHFRISVLTPLRRMKNPIQLVPSCPLRGGQNYVNRVCGAPRDKTIGDFNLPLHSNTMERRVNSLPGDNFSLEHSVIFWKSHA
jgi:hypothetical protein